MLALAMAGSSGMSKGVADNSIARTLCRVVPIAATSGTDTEHIINRCPASSAGVVCSVSTYRNGLTLEVWNIGAVFGHGLIRHQQQALAGATLLTNDASTGCLLDMNIRVVGVRLQSDADGSANHG
jgi:hypothetical protein